MTIILLTIISMLIVALYQLKKRKDIYYSNYQNALLVIRNNDEMLNEWLERNEK